MELSEAVKRQLPLQIQVPKRKNPLVYDSCYAAEVFLVETIRGPGIVWLDPFWNEGSPDQVCHIAYASPNGSKPGRWIDNEPRYGPKCLVCQKPFLMERLDPRSPCWSYYRAWKYWCAGKADECGREVAWKLVEAEFRHLIVERRI